LLLGDRSLVDGQVVQKWLVRQGLDGHVALRGHGFGPWARLFYDTHVVADASLTTASAAVGGDSVEVQGLRKDVRTGAAIL
jgi:hypothetical protein